MRVFLTSLGCKLNQSEVESWARRLAAAGCEIATRPEAADLCVLNTCTVTHVAARKSRQLARHCVRANPSAQVVLTGCYAEISPTEAAQLPGVRLVLGTAEKECLIERIAQEFGPLGAGVPTSLTTRSASQEPPPLRTRAVVKIQDGCNNACTYCIVHIARGQQRSRPLHAVLDEIHARQVEGYQEIVLTGVHIGAYGHERGDTLAQLVSSILAESDIPRLRLTSIEPWDLTLDLLRLWDNPRLCRHLHLPLQSGCTNTLRRMNRRYTAEQYQGLLQAARAAIPDLAVTTDVIVGFPGEDSAEFAESAHFIAAMGFARAHVFPFSARQGTPAADMPDQVPPPIKEERSATMRGIANTTARGFRERFLGRSMDVLWESRKGSTWDGLTDNYLRVEVDSTRSLHNCICPTRLSELTNSGFRGELLIKSEDVTDGANLSRSLTRLVAKA